MDVVIIGAGAAGIGAARALKQQGKSCLVIEARERAGGRVFTDMALGQPFDAGAAYIHFAATNPWSTIAAELGVEPQGGYRLWAGSTAYRHGRALSAAEMARRGTLNRSLAEAYDDVEEASDVSLAKALDEEDQEVRDLGRIQAQMAAGEDPQWISTADWQRLEGGQNHIVPGGYGALVRQAAEPFGVRLGVRATAIDWSGQGVSVATDSGMIRARTAIITVSVGVLQAGHIRFTPALPQATAQALAGLRMGALTKIALQFGAERFDFQPHQFLSEIGDPARAMTFETWPFGHEHVIAVCGGDYARGLARQGEAAVVDHALERFTKIAGGEARKAFKRGRLAAWSEDPFSLGSYAVALPGQMTSREALAQPIADKLWLAGEATVANYSMTAGGAYIAGREAALQAVKHLDAPRSR